MTETNTPGLRHLKQWWTLSQQAEAVALCRDLIEVAPLCRPSTPSGKPMRVRITSSGAAAWWSDADGGYRYRTIQPDGRPLPRAPQWLLDQARFALLVAGANHCEFDAVLLNWYDADAFLSTHRDESEPDMSAPIVSFSLGRACDFNMRGLDRDSAIADKLVLRSGDCVVMAGRARRCYHEVRRIHPLEEQLGLLAPEVPNGADPLLKHPPGRLSILVRRVS